jgi:hypothetical protein
MENVKAKRGFNQKSLGNPDLDFYPLKSRSRQTGCVCVCLFSLRKRKALEERSRLHFMNATFSQLHFLLLLKSLGTHTWFTFINALLSFTNFETDHAYLIVPLNIGTDNWLWTSECILISLCYLICFHEFFWKWMHFRKQINFIEVCVYKHIVWTNYTQKFKQVIHGCL